MLLLRLRRTPLREAAHLIQLIPDYEALKLVFSAAYAIQMTAWLELERGERVVRSYWFIQTEDAS